ncbi:MAG: hypothetical protein H6709_22275 [Kofleriaceae bacterium]|nr:hypothetical protein [Myxococcales bacterium]MCB9564382.1 hypothetical protein [Kofleriaceae bacterium]MCB9574808.1 hypothetical protein [Kofleriaceae bacterium]
MRTPRPFRVRLLLALAVVPLAVAPAACSKKPSGKCDKYADMEVRCGDTNGEGVRSVARSFCEASYKDKSDALSSMIVLEAECAQTTTECAPYHACIEKAKAEHSPFEE